MGCLYFHTLICECPHPLFHPIFIISADLCVQWKLPLIKLRLLGSEDVERGALVISIQVGRYDKYMHTHTSYGRTHSYGWYQRVGGLVATHEGGLSQIPDIQYCFTITVWQGFSGECFECPIWLKAKCLFILHIWMLLWVFNKNLAA